MRYKIGIVSPSFPPKGGGIATSHYNLYLLLMKKHEVKVFVYNEFAAKDDKISVKRKTPAWMIPLLNLSLKIYSRLKAKNTQFVLVRRIVHSSIGAWRLNKPIKRFSPDILIVPDNNIPLYWIRKGKYKIAWFTRNNYLRFRDNPLLTNYNWLDIDVARSMERKAISKADAVLSPSNYMIQEYHRAFTNGHSITVINNFLFEETIRTALASSDGGFNQDERTVFLPSAGTLNKGSRYVFEIIRRISEEFDNSIKFCISGPMTPELKFELSFLSDEISVELPGSISWIENLKYLNNSLLVVSPTLIENYSNAFVEALVLGKPIVTFDVGGNGEIVDDGENGFVVPYLDIDNLIERAVELIRDNKKIVAFSEAAKLKASIICNEQKIMEKYDDFFQFILKDC